MLNYKVPFLYWKLFGFFHNEDSYTVTNPGRNDILVLILKNPTVDLYPNL